jgi:hypothetical protein
MEKCWGLVLRLAGAQGSYLRDINEEESAGLGYMTD